MQMVGGDMKEAESEGRLLLLQAKLGCREHCVQARAGTYLVRYSTAHPPLTPAAFGLIAYREFNPCV